MFDPRCRIISTSFCSIALFKHSIQVQGLLLSLSLLSLLSLPLTTSPMTRAVVGRKWEGAFTLVDGVAGDMVGDLGK